MSERQSVVATDERRQSVRFPAQVETVALCFSTAAQVINESHKGIALVVDSKTKVHVGQEVSIQYDGAPMPAIVRRVDERIDGDFVVGLDWLTRQPQSSSIAASCAPRV